MAIILHLLTVSETQLEQFISKPHSFVNFLHKSGKSRPGSPGGIFSRVFAAFGAPASQHANSQNDRSQIAHIDLNTAWQGIHFLLTDTPNEGDPPICYLLKGGVRIDGTDMGHGPARALRPEEVREYSKALSVISPETLEQRFNPDKMLEIEIYPKIWKKDPRSQDPLEYLQNHFEKLKVFIDAASEEGQAVIIYLSLR